MRRLPWLPLLVSLCLLGLTGAVEAGTAAPTGRSDTLAAVDASPSVVVRSAADRLTPQAVSHRHLLPASLPAAALGALLVAAFVVRRRGRGAAPQTALLAVAGRGPPVTS